MNKEFIEAIEQLEKEKGMSQDLLYEALEAALTKAYKKSVSPGDGRKKDSDINLDVEVRIDRTTGDIEVVAIKEVVEDDELTDPYKQIALSDARMIDPDYEIGEYVEYPKTPDDFGRIAAQTAKNVLVQKIRDAERVMIYNEFIDKKGQVLTGRVARKYNDTIYVNLGKTEGILSAKEQVPGEKFNIDERIKVYVMDVKDPNSEPEPKAGEKRRNGGKHITIGVHRKDWNEEDYYPAYVEYGHGGPGPAPAHPYIRPAYDMTEDEAYEIIRDGLREAIDRQG